MKVLVKDHAELAGLVAAHKDGAPVDINPVMDLLTVRQDPHTEAKVLAAVVAVMAVLVGTGIYITLLAL